MNTIETAAEALENFAEGPAKDAANELTAAFEIAGDRIAASLEQAARTGELSFNNLAESILNDFARIAVSELITAPLEGLVSGLTSSIASASSSSASPVIVNLSAPSAVSPAGGPQASATQIAAQVAQAVARAQSRN